MASRMLRKSGVAVGLVAERLGWRADLIYQVGVGFHHQETDVLSEEWPGVRWIGFEANPDIVRAIYEGYPGRLLNLAISATCGEATLYASKNHADGGSLHRDPGIEKPVQHVVHTMPLDDLPNDLRPAGRVLLWIDCEGHETSVLWGAEEFLHSVEMINIEMTSKPLSPDRCSPREVHAMLTQHGFRRQWIHTGRITLGQYDAIYVRPELFREEYCCDPF